MDNMMKMIVTGLLGFVLGCLLTACFYKLEKRREAARRKEQQRRKRALQQAQRASRLEAQLREQEAQLREQEAQQQLEQEMKQLRERERRLLEARRPSRAAAPDPAEPASKTADTAPKKPPQKFEPVQSLKLEFHSTVPTPEFNPFTPGEGYLRDRENRVIPRETSFQSLNTGRGYAEQGILWAFDAVYRGQCYSFPQLMNGALADRYLRLAAVTEPAVVELQTGYNIYYLKTKGKLEITDP